MLLNEVRLISDLVASGSENIDPVDQGQIQGKRMVR